MYRITMFRLFLLLGVCAALWTGCSESAGPSTTDGEDSAIAHCDDGEKSGDETDIDCGGSCGPCEPLQRCEIDNDCGFVLPALCIGGRCACSSGGDFEQCACPTECLAPVPEQPSSKLSCVDPCACDMNDDCDERIAECNAGQCVPRFMEYDDLSELDLRRAMLAGAQLSYADVSGSDLSGAELSDADLSFLVAMESNFDGARLYETDITIARFRSTSVRNATLERANLSFSDFIEVDFSGSSFDRSIMNDSIFRGSHFAGAVFEDAPMFDSNFSGANFAGATLLHSDLTDSNLSEADFSGAQLTNVDLTGADLSGADFSGATLDGVVLDGATCPDGSIQSDGHECSME